MKTLLNTLYITTPEAYLRKDGTNLVVVAGDTEKFRIPITNLESVCTFGYQGASPGAMKLCSDHGVGLSFFSSEGRFIARIQGPKQGNILLRKRQFELIDDQPIRLHIASRMITAKVVNSRSVLRRFIRDYPDRPGIHSIENSAARLRQICHLTMATDSFDELRGLEGEAASRYFDSFRHLILNTQFKFTQRNRRPPTDPVNAMLSFGYSLLANDCAAALESVGLDPAAGFMHSLRPGRNSLALDLMEEFRAYIVDRLVVSLINTRQITTNDFKIYSNPDNNGLHMPVIMTDNGRKKFLSAWQSKKKIQITHPFLNEKTNLGLLPHIQSLLLARFLRGDIDDYPPFMFK